MDEKIPASLLSLVAEYVTEQMGLDFPDKRRQDLERGLAGAALELGIESVEAYARSIVSATVTDEQIQTLASRLTVGETYFFRDAPSFEILEKQILPELIAERVREQRRLRIWSAGCCTGEEPYSIAILLAKLIPNLRDWSITILGTDINGAALRHASAGAYRSWSFRDTPLPIRNRYFTQIENGMWQVNPEIRKLVSFSFLNLAKDRYPSLETNTNCMDILLCRNVLMYFQSEKVPPVIDRLDRALAPNGWLFVSPSEAAHTLFSQFKIANFPNAIVFRKQEETKPPAPPVTQFVSAPPTAEVVAKAEAYQPKVAIPTAPNGAGIFEQAHELFMKGLHAKAEETLLRIVDCAADPRACTLMTRIFANQGRLGEALEWSGKAIAIDKLNPDYRYLQATVLDEIGETEAAIRALRHTLYLDANHILAHFTLGNLLNRVGKDEVSEVHYRNALMLLEKSDEDFALPDSDGLTVRQLTAAIRAKRQQQNRRNSRMRVSGKGK